MFISRSIQSICCRTFIWGFVLLLGAMSASPAMAESGSNEEARERFVRGVNHYQAGNHEAALAEFVRAYELRPHWALLLNIAQCYATIGRHAEAVAHFEQYLSEGSDEIPDARRAEIESELSRLEAMLGLIDIRTNVEGASVTIDGRDVGRSPFTESVRVRSGLRVVEARLDGHSRARQEVTIAGGEQLTVELTLLSISRAARLRVEGDVPGAVVFVDDVERGPAPWEGALGAGEHVVEIRASGYLPAQRTVVLVAGEEESIDLAPVLATSTSGSGSRRRLSQAWFWSMAAVAVLAAGAATVTGVLALQSQEDLDLRLDDIESGRVTGEAADLEAQRQQLVDDTESLALATDIVIGVAGAAAVTAIVLAFFTRFSRDRSESRLQFTPSLTADGAALTAKGRF